MPGCQGIRFHLGSDNGKLCIIAEPSDRKGHPVTMSTALPTEATLMTRDAVSEAPYFSPDFSCPDTCPPEN